MFGTQRFIHRLLHEENDERCDATDEEWDAPSPGMDRGLTHEGGQQE
ncbi:MAG: hypothetical protein HW422_1338 [Cutibacterium acnes]|nr:hypothetical protein [Cutibacterium acnes]